MDVYVDWNDGNGKHILPVPAGTTVFRLYQLAGGHDGQAMHYHADVDRESITNWSKKVLRAGQTVSFKKQLSD
ncbi:hypothetical protein M1271_07395 [Patescibacteria group bacterium]|nr:hypothetical protein [Patescibacteria group bacterium]MCL5797421.1 hypothetical protein [Patescibacteria group bacterium]